MVPFMIIRIRVAGLTLAVSAREHTDSLGLPKVYEPFRVSRGADIRLTLTTDPAPEPRLDQRLFDSGSVWSVFRYQKELLYTFRTPRLKPSVFKAVKIDPGLRRGTLYFPHLRTGEPPRMALDFPLDELLYQHRLAEEGAVELHACGILLDGQAVLFCGQSGAGKTTTARLWRRYYPAADVLSDDRVVLRQRSGRPMAFGTPWHGVGGFASPASGPVRAVCFLRHGARSALRPLPAPQAAAQLFARSFPPLWKGAAVQAVLRACSSVAESVPCYELGFRPDKSAVTAIVDLLR